MVWADGPVEDSSQRGLWETLLSDGMKGNKTNEKHRVFKIIARVITAIRSYLKEHETGGGIWSRQEAGSELELHIRAANPGTSVMR